jgi:transketolase
MVHDASSGHPGGSLGCTDFFTALYFDIMNYNPKFSMDAKNEDIFFLSKGHISPFFILPLRVPVTLILKNLPHSEN